MHKHDFWNLWPEVIFGREGEGDGSGDAGEGGDGDGDDDGDNSDEDFANLEKALAAERRQNKAKDRELRRALAGKAQKEESENEDLETTKKDLQSTKAKAEKLAAGLLQRDINAAITRAADKLKFVDAEDAINGIDRTTLVFDQDEDDPTDIDIDEDSVMAAVKKLAAKKPHFLTKGTEDGESTGSPMGGSRKRDKKTTEDQLREHYPSL
jgi:hypothetical protein